MAQRTDKARRPTKARQPTKARGPTKGRQPASNQSPWTSVTRLVTTKAYGLVSLGVLLATVVFWALESARLNLSNADQLATPYLFESNATFHGAQFPAQHSFLLKWPLFWLLKLWGYTPGHFVFLTVALVVATIAGFVYLLYRLDRRPMIWGTLCLALASVLLLVPAQPTPGALLPVNMAMLTTRNIEYLLFIASIALLTQVRRLTDWRFILTVVTIAVLVATDKLFLTVSIAGAVLTAATYAIVRNWEQVRFAAVWLLTSIFGAAAGLAMLAVLGSLKVTHIAGQASTAGPYGLITSLHDGVLGSLYAVMGYFTNLGANPGYSAVLVRTIPHAVLHGLLQIGGPSYLINCAVGLAGSLAALAIVVGSLRRSRPAANQTNSATRLSVALVWASVTAIVAFVMTSHYYAVDARYIGIILFTVFVALAVYCRQWAPAPTVVAGVAGLLLLGIAGGLVVSQHTYRLEQAAMDDTVDRNANVAAALDNHPEAVLVGDYWRVLPIKAAMRKPITAMPLWSCQHVRMDLTSSTWQPDLHHHSFAYLLPATTGPAGFAPCSLRSVLATYGRPTASVLLRGSLSQPNSQLLLYDRGIHHPSGQQGAPVSQTPSTVLPIPLADAPSATCNGSMTIVTVVAHQDDDLLFINPDTLHAIQAGDCVRTIYLTAGDSGINNRYYWLGREQGAEAAYASMLGFHGSWVQRIIQLSNTSFVSLASPIGYPKVSLVFFRLPDGNLTGKGFPQTHFESLAKLADGSVARIHSVDNQSNYSADELTGALVSLLNYFTPTAVHTQASLVSKRYPDHSDHITTRHFTMLAVKQYEASANIQKPIPVTYYVGYPVHGMPPNITGKDLAVSSAAYYAYAAHDQAACQTPLSCEQKSTFGLYLDREYTNPY